VLVRYQAGRAVGQAMRDADFLDLVAQALAYLFGEVLEFAGGRFGFLLLGFVFQLAEIQAALGHRHQLLALELGQVRDHPFVDAVGEQDDLDALLAENFQVRAVLRRVEGSAVT
jgi:hypothetical protein